MPSAVIADDEPLARKRVRMMLARHRGYEIVAECRDGEETVTALIEHEPDVLFLDVKMPGLDGFEVLSALSESKRPAAVVFVTAFADRAVAAFDQDAADFLLKPYDRERFARAIERVDQRLSSGEPRGVPRQVGAVLRAIDRPRYAERFLVRGPKHLYFVRTDDVEWLDSAANYVRLHVGGRVHFVRETMKTVAERLPPDRFVRVHRSIVVNLDCVQRLEPFAHGEYTITMRDGSRIRSSRTHNEQLRRMLREAT